MFSLNTGALYIKRKAEVKIAVLGQNVVQDLTFTDIQIPVLLEVKLGTMFAFGAGIAYNLGQGNIILDQTDPTGLLGGNVSGRSETYSQANTPTSDLAAEIAANVTIPIGAKAGIFVQADYQLGITNMDTTGNTTQKVNMIQGLAGISINF